MPKKNPNNKTPHVSIVTPTFKRSKLLEILADCISNQKYPIEKIEWVIVDGENEEKFYNLVPDVIKTINNKYPKLKINYVSHPMNEKNMIGGLRNKSNEVATYNIIICMDDDDYYPPNKIVDTLKALKYGKKKFAACKKIYLYDFDTEAFMYGGNFIKNYCINNSMAYTKDYLKNHSYDPLVPNQEERSFTNNYTETYEELNPNTAVLHFSHLSNTWNKRTSFERAYYSEEFRDETKNNCRPNKNIYELISKDLLDRYDNLFLPYKRHSVYVPYDIVFYCGTLSFEWDPENNSLGGSEQAVVELASYWSTKGLKVAVYGRIKNNKGYRGVDYFDSSHFKASLRYKKLILWRAFGFNSMIKWNIKADKIYLDLHDTIAIDPKYLNQYINKLDGIFVKSQFHGLVTYNYSGKNPKIGEKIRVIMNGVRVDQFKKNSNYQRNNFRLCYTSCYTRGLLELIKYFFPILKKKIPEAELHIYYGYSSKKELQDLNNNIKRIIDNTDGIFEHGRVSVDKIIEEKYKSGFHLYFTDTDSETDCISVRESLVAGCIPIISNYGVFMERDGLKYNLSCKDPSSYEKIANDVAELMMNNEKIKQLRNKLLKSETIQSWNQTGEYWLQNM